MQNINIMVKSLFRGRSHYVKLIFYLLRITEHAVTIILLDLFMIHVKKGYYVDKSHGLDIY